MTAATASTTRADSASVTGLTAATSSTPRAGSASATGWTAATSSTLPAGSAASTSFATPATPLATALSTATCFFDFPRRRGCLACGRPAAGAAAVPPSPPPMNSTTRDGLPTCGTSTSQSGTPPSFVTCCWADGKFSWPCSTRPASSALGAATPFDGAAAAARLITTTLPRFTGASRRRRPASSSTRTPTLPSAATLASATSLPTASATVTSAVKRPSPELATVAETHASTSSTCPFAASSRSSTEFWHAATASIHALNALALAGSPLGLMTMSASSGTVRFRDNGRSPATACANVALITPSFSFAASTEANQNVCRRTPVSNCSQPGAKRR